MDVGHAQSGHRCCSRVLVKSVRSVGDCHSLARSNGGSLCCGERKGRTVGGLEARCTLRRCPIKPTARSLWTRNRLCTTNDVQSLALRHLLRVGHHSFTYVCSLAGWAKTEGLSLVGWLVGWLRRVTTSQHYSIGQSNSSSQCESTEAAFIVCVLCSFVFVFPPQATKQRTYVSTYLPTCLPTHRPTNQPIIPA